MANEQTPYNEQLGTLIEAVELGETRLLTKQLAEFHPAEIAELIEAVQPKQRFYLWQLISKDKQGETLKELSAYVQTQLIEEMGVKALVEVTENFEVDDLADIIPNLTEEALHYLLLSMDEKLKEHLKAVLTYGDDTAGGLMNTDIIAVRANITVDTVLRYIRLLKKIPSDTDQIFVVDRNYHFIGSIYLSVLLTQDPMTKLISLLPEDETIAIDVHMNADEVSQLFARRNLISAPVIDGEKKLLGRITVDDVVDVIRDEAESSVKGMAGVNDEDVFDSVKQAIKNRSIWLGINLITIFIAVFFIGVFSDTLEKQVALAVLMPVVASMGGIAGSQTLILVTRGIAVGKVSAIYFTRLLSKELLMGLLNGLVWSSVIGSITYVWFGNLVLSIVIAVAVVFNLIIAAVSGVFLPIILTRFKIDPALAGGVVLTTITDVVGFVVFLALAAGFLPM